MYLVEPSVFKTFLDKNNLARGFIPAPKNIPCIIEFHRSYKVAAKVEVLSINEFSHVVRFGKSVSGETKNKYWIRGKEWEIDKDGNPIMELRV